MKLSLKFTAFALLAMAALTIAVSSGISPELVFSAARDAFAQAPVGSDVVLAMATLAVNKPRDYEIGDNNAYPVIAGDIIYEGAAVGDNAAGLARPLVALDPFLGFATRTADNSAGAASAIRVEVKQRGEIVLTVATAASANDVSEIVYALDDDSFTLVSTGATAIGKVLRHISGTTCLVYFEALPVRSL